MKNVNLVQNISLFVMRQIRDEIYKKKIHGVLKEENNLLIS